MIAWLRRIARRIEDTARQSLCRLQGGHFDLLTYGSKTVHLRCWRCGRETNGWQ